MNFVYTRIVFNADASNKLFSSNKDEKHGVKRQVQAIITGIQLTKLNINLQNVYFYSPNE